MDPAVGLSESEAARRLREYGPNRLPEAAPESLLAIVGRQFVNPLVALLAAAVAVSLALGELLDAAVILAIVLLNAALGALEEGRAGAAARAVRSLLAPRAVVLREGVEREIGAEKLVPGDLAVLREGDRVAADGRLLEAARLEIDESALTGESLPVAKRSDPPASPHAPLAERATMLYAGTTVVRGAAHIAVAATGRRTEMGRIASSVPEHEEATPLQVRLARFARVLLVAAAVVCVLLAGLALAHGESLADSVLVGVSLAVAAVPEGLPAVLTVTLALGMRRLARRGAIVRRLNAVETLGSTSVICTDKTGTLTQNRMTLVRAYVCPAGEELAAADLGADRDELIALLSAAVVASEATVRRRADGEGFTAVGDATEAPIVLAAAERGITRERALRGASLVRVEPFDSERKRLTAFVDGPGDGGTVYVKGAPEALLPRLADAAVQAGLAEVAARWAADGMRVLAVASRPLRGEELDPERDLQPLGLVALADPVRPAAAESVSRAADAGVRTVMITGDHPGTAFAIARATGIAADTDRVLRGDELDRMPDDELAAAVEEADVFARVVPEHKLRIVRALQGNGQVVAMTGDGVNDVPALQAAHIGVAMGQRGTDAASEAADMVLTDDDYSTLVAAIEGGRAVYQNIQRFVQFLLAANAGEVLLFALAIPIGFPAPLTVLQILLVNLLTDGAPAVALAVDPPDRDTMRRSPRRLSEGLLDPIWTRILVGGGVTGAAAFASFLIGDQAQGQELARTMAFVTVVAAQLFYVWTVRGDDWFFRAGGNPALHVAVAGSAVVLALVLSVPALADRIDVVSLGAGHLAAALGLALVPLAVSELLKALWR